jgi:hypothetical protein
MDRHARQSRLPEIGAAGQSRIAGADVTVRLDGFAGEVAARYLAGAGVGRLRVRDAAVAAAASAVDPGVKVVLESSREEGIHPPAFALDEFRDPVARDLARGAHEALTLLRTALEKVPS